jgi:hypothetical protein
MIFVDSLIQECIEQYVGILDLMIIRLPCQKKKLASLVHAVTLICITFASMPTKYPKLKPNKNKIMK